MATVSTAPKRAYRVVTVNIQAGIGPSVDLDPVKISIERGDVICWHCDGDPSWEVDFGGNSPFDKTRFNQGNGCSGPAKAVGNYKYAVRAGGGTFDPTVIVN